MLPSTGYFTSINCPFYDSGLCERPYCHFRHVKRELTEAPTSSVSQGNVGNSAQAGSSANVTAGDNPDSDILQRLVSEAVKKVLQHQEMLVGSVSSVSESSIPQALVSQVVEELKPSTSQLGTGLSSESISSRSHKAYLPPVGIPSYKPTPISELKKRHIPVPYTPSPSPRGSSKVQVKRLSPPDDNSKQKRLKPVVKDTQKTEPALEYNPESEDFPKNVPYSPTSRKYPSSHNGWSGASKPPSYIPSSIDTLPKCSNDYVPAPVTSSLPVPQYCPSEKLVSNSEPNYVPEGSQSSSAGVLYTPTTKTELDDDIVDIDLSTEFDLLDEILNENSDELNKLSKEKKTDKEKTVIGVDVNCDEHKLSAETNKPNVDITVKVESKEESQRSRHRSKSHGHDRPNSETRLHSSSSKRKEKLKKDDKSKSKRHSSQKTKEHEHKKHEHIKHSSSSRSEHRRSNDRGSKSDKGDKNDKKENSDNRSQKHKLKDESKVKDPGKEKRTHHSEKETERHLSSKTRVKAKNYSSSSRSKRGSHDHRHRDKHTSEKHRRGSKSRNTVAASKKSSKDTEGENEDLASSPDAASEEDYSSSNDADTGEANVNTFPEEIADISVSDSESDEDTITQECYRIFKEYDPQQSQHIVSKKSLKVEEPVREEEIPARKRIAHEGAVKYPPLSSAPVKQQPNPMHLMNLRIAKMKELKERSVAEAVASSMAAFGSGSNIVNSVGSSTSAGSSASTGGRIRIAHVPYVSRLLSAKSRIQASFGKRKLGDTAQMPTSKSAFSPAENSDSHTVVHTVPKGAQRVAHKPSSALLTQPKVVGELGGKIPANIRQCYLNHLVAEYLKLFPNPTDAHSKAIEEEAVIYNRSTTRSVYSSHMSNKINRLRKEATAEVNPGQHHAPTSTSTRVFSHSSILAGHSGTKGTWSIKKHTKTQGSKPTSESFYQLLVPYILTDEQLCSNGFPRAHPEEKGVAVVHLPQGTSRQPPLSPNRKRVLRICSRCNQNYSVNKNGFQVKDEQCVYHWGRMFMTKVKGGWERRYGCCSSDGEGGGCTVASCHVCDGFDPDELRGFVKTLPRDQETADGDHGIYALDCEMCYTTVGLELTRITVINQDLNTVYESLVKPEYPIIDYNTRFSGIKEEDMFGVKTSIYDVQATLLSLIHDRTILIGHSLDSDFKALKMIHSTVVDTSIVFPHKMGPPKKRALKTLCREHLNKIIQESVDGHDSAEDAKTCMELMLWKMRES